MHLLLITTTCPDKVIVVNCMPSRYLAALDTLCSVAVGVRAALAGDPGHLVAHMLRRLACSEAVVVSMTDLAGASCAVEHLDWAVSEGGKD